MKLIDKRHCRAAPQINFPTTQVMPIPEGPFYATIARMIASLSPPVPDIADSIPRVAAMLPMRYLRSAVPLRTMYNGPFFGGVDGKSPYSAMRDGP